MPLSITLSDGTTTATLTDGTNFDIHYGGLKLGMPTRNRVYAQPWGRGFAPFAGQTDYNRECTIDLFIRGASLDNWNANYRSIAGLLKGTGDYWRSNGAFGAACTLSVQLNGQTNATAYDVLAGDIDANDVGHPSMTITTGPWLSTAKLVLTLKPYGRPTALTTVTSAVLTNGGGVSGGQTTAMSHLFTPLGDQNAPVRLTITGLSSGAISNASQRFVVGRRTRGLTSNFISVFHAETTIASSTGQSTYPGYTVLIPTSGGGIDRVADTSAENGAFTRLRMPTGAQNATRRMSWGIDSASDFMGSFRVYLRMASGAGTATDYGLSIGWGGDSATYRASNAPVVTPIGATARIFDMGTITVPLNDAPTTAVPTMWIHLLASATSGTSANAFGVDALYLVPSDEQFVEARFSTAAADILVLNDLSPIPNGYTLTSASVPRSDIITMVQRTPLSVVPGRGNIWVALAMEEGAGTTNIGYSLARTFTMSFDYYPLYDQFAS